MIMREIKADLNLLLRSTGLFSKMPRIQKYLNGDGYYYEFISCDSTIYSGKNIKVCVNLDGMNSLAVPCIKVYNNSYATLATKVARLHFLDSDMEYKDHGYKHYLEAWDIPQDVLDLVVEEVRDKWVEACYWWNFENYTFEKSETNYRDYEQGKYDNDNNTKLYLPSTIKMPDRWVFDKDDAERNRKYYLKTSVWEMCRENEDD